MAGFLMNVGKAGEVAERSPAVISANLKEDMLLQKKMVILNRSERSVVHQIKVDQKVLYKRFQSRLVRSKLALARIMGNKDIEMELRSKNLGGLNTDIVAQTDEEYSFLAKLEHRPCTANTFSPRVVGRRESRREIHKEDVDKLEKAVSDKRASSAKARLEVISEDGKEQTKDETQESGPMRPSTTIGLRLDSNMLLQNRMKRRQMSPIQEGVEMFSDAKHKNGKSDNKNSVHVSDGEASVTSKHTDDDETTVTSEEKATEVGDEYGHRKQAVAFIEDFDHTNVRPQSMGHLQNYEESPPISPRQLSRRTSKAADFFQEEKKHDMVGLRLLEAKSKDFTERVKSFCEEIEEMNSPSNKPSIDYYASRLLASEAERLSRISANVPGTPEDENKRSVGNIFVRSLTLPVINRHGF